MFHSHLILVATATLTFSNHHPPANSHQCQGKMPCDLLKPQVMASRFSDKVLLTVIYLFQHDTFAHLTDYQFSSVQSLSRLRLFVTPWTAARQASLSITNSRSPPKPVPIELVMPSNRLILCRPLPLPSIFPSIRVFSNESPLPMRWPKYWSFSFNISPSNEHPGLISFRSTGWISLQSKGLWRVLSNTTVQKHQL